MHNFTLSNLVGCCSGFLKKEPLQEPIFRSLKNMSTVLVLMFFFFASSHATFAQSGCECDDPAGSFGPEICKAKLYCSNNAIVDDGVINCTTAADTDGCGIDTSVGAPIKISTKTLFQQTLDCSVGNLDNLFVEWIKFYTPAGVNQFVVQGVGGAKLKGYAIYHKENNQQFISENTDCLVDEDFSDELLDKLTYVGCTTAQQFTTFQDPTAVIDGETKNLYYIAFIYDRISNGTVNFKVKDCIEEEGICEDVAINCPQNVTVPACATTAELMTAFDNFKAGFSFSGGGPAATDNLGDFPAFP
ncbi:MAG: hypothetical protein R3213_10870, partial [Flavobacteriaceae bacterium]|nr:hypothetical protein [Flavobacteriaceae bacterium]